MNSSLDQSTLESLSRLVTKRMGLLFPPDQWGVLEQAFSRAAAELDFATLEERVQWFISAPESKELVETVAAYLTIGETYFFREQQAFEILEGEILPEVIRGRGGGEKRLRIWSAGCASGEEAYSLAILLHQMEPLLRDWELSILATDINPQALSKARGGIYSDWSFRNTPAWVKQRYFTPLERGRFELNPAIRKMVRFAYFNMVADPCPAQFTETNAMDIILCRNVLMYFPSDVARRVVEWLRNCLVDGGWLVVSSCELSMTLFSGFSAVNYAGATFYRKQGDEGAVPERTITRPPLFDIAPPISRPFFPAASSTATEASPVCCRQENESESTEKPVPQCSTGHGGSRTAADLCRMYANEGDLDQALCLADQAINGDKLNAGLHYLRALILQEHNREEEAARSLRRALYLDEGLVVAHFSMANLALQQGKGREAHKHFDHALSILEDYQPDEVLPESEGMPAGRLREIIRATNAGAQQETFHE